jgi:small subunit ribosomal protein S8
MLTDSIADLLTRIRNAQSAGHKMVSVSSSKMATRILDVLKDEGFIASYKVAKKEGAKFEMIDVHLKYFSSGAPVIGSAKRVSTSGKRVYSASEDLPKIHSGLGISIVSTSQGVMSDREARKRKIGGEVLAQIG